MKNVPQLETIEQGKTFTELNICPALYYAYHTHKGKENELLDLCGVIWPYDVPLLCENCKDFGITAFTISRDASGWIELLEAFAKQGFHMDGFLDVRVSRFYDDPPQRAIKLCHTA